MLVIIQFHPKMHGPYNVKNEEEQNNQQSKY
jgi:hypothetical protein